MFFDSWLVNGFPNDTIGTHTQNLAQVEGVLNIYEDKEINEPDLSTKFLKCSTS